jgi:hypothetical protein
MFYNPKLNSEEVIFDTSSLETSLIDLKNTIMALMSGGLGVTFPSSIAVTGNVGILGTVATTTASMSTLGTEKIYPVTLTSASIPLVDIPVGTKGAQIQYLSSSTSDRLYSRTDAVVTTALDSQTTALQVITLESLLDVQNFRFMGSVGTNIKVVFRG